MSKVVFLGTATENAEAMRTLLRSHSSSEPIRIAVAFWGQGAEDIIGCSSSCYQIICNLRSGGTNPAVVRSLQKMKNVSVYQLDTLHAKVVIADAGALISSANVSTNGLALEGVTAQTWQEAGVLLPWAATSRSETIDWFQRLWDKARAIEDSDLEQAELLWQQNRSDSDERKHHAASSDALVETLITLKTVKFPGRAPMTQVYLRSAAALVALGGYGGQEMPTAPFKFLFCGGTTRAFKHHKDKFVEDGESVRLDENLVGYFIGADGTMPSSGRFKSLSENLIRTVADWMLGRGSRPEELQGTAIEGRFLLR